MKKSGICPKCQSRDILVFESKDDESKKHPLDSEAIGILGKRVYTSRYVCCNCGYTERYFDDDNLEKLKKKYKKVRG